MSQLEDLKQQLLDMFEQFNELDIESTPVFYFKAQLRNKLYMYYSFSQGDAKRIAGNIGVDLSGLGLDHEPHKEFLNNLVDSVAKTIDRSWPVWQEHFGSEVAFKQISNFKVHLA